MYFNRIQHVFRVTGLLFVVLGVLSMSAPALAQNGNAQVRVVEIHGTIDLGLAPFLQRAIDEAESDNVEALILDIDTPGGRLDATFQMRDALIGAEVPTIAYINRDAFSAGALIALACEQIYMAPGGTMGAATPVTQEGETASEKNVSAVRSSFRSTAEARGRNPDVAEAMVDPSVEVEGLVNDEQLVSLTAEEALEWGMSDGTVEDLDALLAEIGLAGASVNTVDQSWAESFVRIITEPVIASLLFSIGSLLIIFDILSGELSPLSAIGVGVLALFFWGHFLAGLAGWEGILLVVLGIALLVVEIFIIPGFGVFGILGLVSLTGGLFLSLLGGEVVLDSDLQRAALTAAGAMVMVLVGIVFMFIYLPTLSNKRGLVLQARLGDEEPPPQQEPRLRRWFRSEEPATEPQIPTMPPRQERPSLLGARGRALSDLRPGGFARINGQRVDVVTQGDYIEAGDMVEVVADDQYRRVVTRIEEEPEQNNSEAEMDS